jgi:hypothetical protein
MRFEGTSWIIPGLLPVGLTLLAAPSKTGKSYLALGLLLRHAYLAAGTGDGAAMSCLYLSLDDPSLRRIQTRVWDILDGRPMEGGVSFATHAATLDTGLCRQLDNWLEENPDTRIVVIDALATVKAKRSSNDVFQNDYNGLHGLPEVALKRNIAIILVHHTRKRRDSDDWMNNVSGSMGITAMADAIWLLDRPRGSAEERLLMTGRDFGDTVASVPIDDLLEGEWPSGDTQPAQETFLTDQALAFITSAGSDGMSRRELIKRLGVTQGQLSTALRALEDAGRITRLRYGQYAACMETDSTPCANPEILCSGTPQNDNDAWLETSFEGPQTQEPSGPRPLSQNSVHTVSCESGASPEIVKVDAQQYSCFQPDGITTAVPTGPQDVAATARLMDPTGATAKGAYNA